MYNSIAYLSKRGSSRLWLLNFADRHRQSAERAPGCRLALRGREQGNPDTVQVTSPIESRHSRDVLQTSA